MTVGTIVVRSSIRHSTARQSGPSPVRKQNNSTKNMMKRMSLKSALVGGSTAIVPSEESSTVAETTQFSKGARQSLTGAILSRKFAKRLSTKFMDRKLGSAAGMFHDREPTYSMEPSKKFSSSCAEKVIKDVLDDKLTGYKYNPQCCSKMMKYMSEEIKDRIKCMGFDRYKILCTVVLCQRVEQAAVCSSRCIMDTTNDTYATYTFKNEQFICNASVYGLYRE